MTVSRKAHCSNCVKIKINSRWYSSCIPDFFTLDIKSNTTKKKTGSVFQYCFKPLTLHLSTGSCRSEFLGSMSLLFFVAFTINCYIHPFFERSVVNRTRTSLKDQLPG